MFSIFTYFWSFSPYFVVSPIFHKTKKSFISNTHHLQFHRKKLKHTTTTLTTELPLSLSLSHHRVTFSNATFVSIKEARESQLFARQIYRYAKSCGENYKSHRSFDCVSHSGVFLSTLFAHARDVPRRLELFQGDSTIDYANMGRFHDFKCHECPIQNRFAETTLQRRQVRLSVQSPRVGGLLHRHVLMRRTVVYFIENARDVRVPYFHVASRLCWRCVSISKGQRWRL